MICTTSAPDGIACFGWNPAQRPEPLPSVTAAPADLIARFAGQSPTGCADSATRRARPLTRSHSPAAPNYPDRATLPDHP